MTCLAFQANQLFFLVHSPENPLPKPVALKPVEPRIGSLFLDINMSDLEDLERKKRVGT